MSFAQYMLGVGELALAGGAVAYGAWSLRGRLLPGWGGAPARLGEAILALCLLLWVAELLGAVGLFKPIPVLLGYVLAGAIAAAFGRPTTASTNPAPPVGPWIRAAALIVVALVVAGWSERTLLNLDRGMIGFDTLWYHMPFAARFVQDASVVHLHFTDPLYLNWFYPQNSELLHGVGILLFRHHDVLSPLVNLGFLGLALLAAWCAGRPFRAGALSLVAVAIVLDAQLLASRAGEANNDIVGLAFFFSSVALLLNLDRDRAPAPSGLLVAALAAGLALGTKLTLLAPVGLLTIGVIAIAPAGRRLATSGVWLGGLLASGGFWYLRNLIAVGNPIPALDLSVLPTPERLIHGRPDFSVAHYLTDSDIWGRWFVPGLEDGLGTLWFVILGLAVAGVLLTALRGRSRLERMLAAVAAVGAVAYLFTPLGAAGPEGQPVGFAINLRYFAPPLCLGLILLTINPELRGRREPLALALFAAVLLIGDKPFSFLDGERVAAAVALGALAALLPLIPAALERVQSAGIRRTALLVAAGVLAVALIGQGYRVQRDYVRGRYAHPQEKFGLGIGFTLARELRDERIGLAGTTSAFVQYGLYGTDVSNRVQYLGDPGPHGSFGPLLDCASWRRAVNEGDYSYLVTAPMFRFQAPDQPAPAPERRWIAGDPAAKRVRDAGDVAIFHLSGPLDPAGCPPDAPRFPLERELREERLPAEELPR